MATWEAVVAAAAEAAGWWNANGRIAGCVMVCQPGAVNCGTSPKAPSEKPKQ